MANFSFGKFFGRGARQPRFQAGGGGSSRVASEGHGEMGEGLPVGRLVSFTDHGPEDGPLFQEVETPHGSPFVVVGGARPSGGGSVGGLPEPARNVGEEGFTAEELSGLVPARWVRPGAVPPSQVIGLPPAVLRASLGAGQPAVLLSQLHQACPALFIAPTSLDEDLVIALPPQKVQRLVARGDGVTSAAAAGSVPLARPIREMIASENWSMPEAAAATDSPAAPAFAVPPSRVKLPPPRRKTDEIHGVDFRPLMTAADGLEDHPLFASESSDFIDDAPAVASPFQVASALPTRPGSRGGGMPKRFESPFSIVSPGEVPAVLESPFARQPFVGGDARPTASPPAHGDSDLDDFHPPLPATIRISLQTLLRGQPNESLGFAPDSVPPQVKVTLKTEPLLAQVATGRVRVPLDDVMDGLDTKYHSAFQNTQPGMQFPLPLWELFAHVPGAAPPTPTAPEVHSAFDTPFSIRAEEDTSLTTANSPFEIRPTPAPKHHAPETPATAPTPTPPPENHPDPSSMPTPAAVVGSPFLIVPDAPVAPNPVDTPSAEQPPAPPPLPPPLPRLDRVDSPIPELPPPFLFDPVPSTPPPTPPPTAVRAESSTESSSPEISFASATPPPPVVLPPLPSTLTDLSPPSAPTNPFAQAPGEGRRHALAFDLPILPFDDDPVPLESLREEPVAYRLTPPEPAPTEPAPTEPASTEPASPELATPGPLPPTAASAPPPEPAPLHPAPEAPAAFFPAAPPPAIPAVPWVPVPQPPPVSATPVEAPLEPPTSAAAVPPIPPPAPPNPATLPPTEPIAAWVPPAFEPAAPVEPPASIEHAPSIDPPAAIEPPVAPAPRPVRLALSEQEPMPPPLEWAQSAAGQGEPSSSVDPRAIELENSMATAEPPTTMAPALSAEVPATPAPSRSPFLDASAFQLPPLPAELTGGSGLPATPVASEPPPPAAATSSLAPALPELTAPPAAAFGTGHSDQAPHQQTPELSAAPAVPTPPQDQREAFVSVFAPSALARPPGDTAAALGDMDVLPAIALAKLPPLDQPEPAPPSLPPSPAFPEPPAPASELQPPPPAAAPVATDDSSPSGLIEDLGFGYVDNPVQLALRAVFATDRTLATQDVVDLAATLDGLQACLVHTPHASLHSSVGACESEEVRHFRERASALFEKTASLVRELDPSAREQCFTLRTAKGVVSFFAIDDVCLAVLHAEPSFRPGVREKLTLVTRSVADMLAA